MYLTKTLCVLISVSSFALVFFLHKIGNSLLKNVVMSKYTLNKALAKLIDETPNINRYRLSIAAGVPSSYISTICNNKQSLGSKSFYNLLVNGFGVSRDEAKKMMLPLLIERAKEEWAQL
jgi:archaellum component FlaF (FlaF/FlaG flagellin family)